MSAELYNRLNRVFRFDVEAAPELLYRAADIGHSSIYANCSSRELGTQFARITERANQVTLLGTPHTVVLTLPVLTEVTWFHDWVLGRAACVLFLKGALSSGKRGGSLVAVWTRKQFVGQKVHSWAWHQEHCPVQRDGDDRYIGVANR